MDDEGSPDGFFGRLFGKFDLDDAVKWIESDVRQYNDDQLKLIDQGLRVYADSYTLREENGVKLTEEQQEECDLVRKCLEVVSGEIQRRGICD